MNEIMNVDVFSWQTRVTDQMTGLPEWLEQTEGCLPPILSYPIFLLLRPPKDILQLDSPIPQHTQAGWVADYL